MTELLRLENWTVRLPGRDGPLTLLDGIDLAVAEGEAVALSGPSGSGKSLTALSACGLLPPTAVTSGRVLWRGAEIGGPGGRPWSGTRGRGVTLVLQDPAAALNPVLRVGDQVAETVRRHGTLSAAEAADRALALLAEAGLPDPVRAARSWPHQLSGGMQQRALIAAALACEPDLLIADEPTTALDPPVQAEVLAMLDRLRRRRGMALLFISHDDCLVELMADRRVDLRAGRVVTPAPTTERITLPAAAPATAPVLVEARGLVVRHRGADRAALAGVDLDLRSGRVLGLTGASGGGKSTLARVLTGHGKPDAGRVLVAGEDFYALRGDRRRHSRRRAQLLFQDAGGSLDPRLDLATALREAAPTVDVPAALAAVGLAAELGRRLPHQLSGGQRQRAALARCLAVEPALLVADEPASALDPSTRRRILALLAAAARERELTVLLISHDLTDLRQVCDAILVMDGGRLVDRLERARGWRSDHPLVRRLLAAEPARLAADPAAWRHPAEGS